MTGPITTSAYPLAVNPGKTALLELHGPGTDPTKKVSLAVPKDQKPGQHYFALSPSARLRLPLPLVVTTLPISVESSDVPAAGDPGKSGQAARRHLRPSRRKRR